MWVEIFRHGLIATLPISIMGIGVYTVGNVLNNLIKNRSEITSTREKKDCLDEVLVSYNYSYKIDFKVIDTHGSLGVESHLVLEKNRFVIK